ncbi:MAG: hypothetical protein ACOY3P_04700 [Planctomycetota bacterium]
MAIKLQCPRCKKSLAVPSKKANSYVSCPNCSGRFWVPKDPPPNVTPPEGSVEPPDGKGANASPRSNGGTPVAPSAIAASVAVPSPVMSAQAVAPVPTAAMPAASAPAELPGPPASPPVVSSGGTRAGSPRQRKKARFISAEAAQSTLTLAADGKLPDLQLQETDAPKEAAQRSRSMSPMALAAVLVASVVLSIAMVLMGGGNSAGDSLAHEKAQARTAIELDFTQNIDRQKALAPYQHILRESLRAHARGDIRAEHRGYRRVMELLRAERLPTDPGLTGSRKRDAQLEEHLTVLLRQP